MIYKDTSQALYYVMNFIFSLKMKKKKEKETNEILKYTTKKNLLSI